MGFPPSHGQQIVPNQTAPMRRLPDALVRPDPASTRQSYPWLIEPPDARRRPAFGRTVLARTDSAVPASPRPGLSTRSPVPPVRAGGPRPLRADLRTPSSLPDLTRRQDTPESRSETPQTSYNFSPLNSQN